MLFSIYVNDLPGTITFFDINMYADDTELHFSHSDLSVVEKTLQAEVENIFTWLVVNRLRLSVSKSLCMLIGSHQRTRGLNLTLTLDGDILRQVSSTKYYIWAYIWINILLGKLMWITFLVELEGSFLL